MPERPLQRRLHLHVLELADGEVEVLDGICAFVGVVDEEPLTIGRRKHLSDVGELLCGSQIGVTQLSTRDTDASDE